MKARTILAIVVLLAWSSVGKAGIIGLNGADDGDGAVSCTGIWLDPNLETPSKSGELSLNGTQAWGPGHIVGAIDTNSNEDPTIKYINSITNETTFAWNGYIVDYTLQSRITDITGGELFLVTDPTGWTGTITQPLAYVTDVTIGGVTYKEYKGQITYLGGTPVEIGSDLDFTYSLKNLTGSTKYIYTQEMTPIPEPSTLVLLSMACLGVLAYAWRRYHRS
jgi:hypothetical protein